MELLSKPDAIKESSWLTFAYESFNFDSFRSFLIAMGSIVIGIIALSNIIGIITTYFHLKISWDVAHRLSTNLLKVYTKKPYSYFLNHNTSDLRSYLVSEVSVLTSGVLIPLIEFISRSIISLVIFTLLMLVSLKITLVMAFFLGGTYFLIYLLRQKALKRLGNERFSSNANRFRYLEEMLTGIKTVKIYGVQDFFFQRFEKESRQYNNIHPKVQMVYATPKYILEILAFGGILAVTMYLFVSNGNITDSLPRLSLYALAGYRLLPALQRAFAAAAKVKHNLPVLRKLYDDLILAKDQSGDISSQKAKLAFQDKISIEHLSYTYEGNEASTLKNLNLSIKKGSTVAFVGSTGSGKTTLIDIITGLLTPSSGHLKIDDTVVQAQNVTEWQNNIAYVPQEVFLYDDTIKANIALNNSESVINEKRITEVLKMTGMYTFISTELSDGINTKIGERGVRLSGGQRQRLGLARALYTNPSLLVLDEATSALDNITEKGIIDSLLLLPDELTIIIIAHRLSTVKYANTIFMLEDGKMINHGNYDELIKGNSKFKEMDQLSWGNQPNP
ncbi:MAG: ABC transporter ATP-binding protein [Flavobacteriales bacterium]|nr:ABC transporter ATP-binding protein [Flavobacteriales bacterium]